MAAKVEVPYKHRWECPRDIDTTFRYFADFNTAVPQNFPGIDKFEEIRPGVFLWTFQQIGYGGYELNIKLATKFDLEAPGEIRITPVAEPNASRLQGSWRFTAQGPKTIIDFNFTLEIELPIPSFLKKMADPVVNKEITKLFERYVADVAKHLSA
jgi:hypothetical protein